MWPGDMRSISRNTIRVTEGSAWHILGLTGSRSSAATAMQARRGVTIRTATRSTSVILASTGHRLQSIDATFPADGANAYSALHEHLSAGGGLLDRRRIAWAEATHGCLMQMPQLVGIAHHVDRGDPAILDVEC